MTVTVKTQSADKNGKVRRRYEVTLTDLLGAPHTQVVGMFTHDPSNDGSEVESQMLEDAKQQEAEQYKTDIIEGTNPFLGDSWWLSKNELLKAVLDDALSLPATEQIVLSGLPYMALVTDAELMFIYNQTQTWVDSVRLKTTNLLTAKLMLDNYEAPL